jgi:hypothetical protein
MVNTRLFQTLKGAQLPDATARNHEGAPAYALSARHQLAQLAATGCLNQTFYASADSQLDMVRALAQTVDAAFATGIPGSGDAFVPAATSFEDVAPRSTPKPTSSLSARYHAHARQVQSLSRVSLSAHPPRPSIAHSWRNVSEALGRC